MGIKKKDDSINPLSKPLEDLAEVVAWRKNAQLESYHSEKRVLKNVRLRIENMRITASTQGQK